MSGFRNRSKEERSGPGVGMQPRVWMTILDALYRTRFLGQDKLKRACALSGLRPSELPRYVPASDHPRESFVGPGATGSSVIRNALKTKHKNRDGWIRVPFPPSI